MYFGDYNLDLLKIKTNNCVRMHVNNISCHANVQLIYQLKSRITQKHELITYISMILASKLQAE